MLSKKLEEALNGHINQEIYAAYLYLSMSAYFESINLSGLAHWMRAQSNEELSHAMKIYKYIFDRGGRVQLLPVEGPPAEWKSPLAAFQDAYKHEKKITGLINKLADKAVAENDHATNIFLHWLVSEQVEEEATACSIVEKLKLVGESGGGLFMIDRELGQRQ